MMAKVALALLLIAAGCSIDSGGLNAAPSTFDATITRDAEAARDAADPPRDSGPPDRDGDGVPASVDCDDADPTVGRAAERACASACAPGLERCTDGVWLTCDAPTDCTCTAGETRTLPCELCGTQAQSCVGGTWQNDGVCAGSGVCSPGDLRSEMRPCGRCGAQRRTSTCTASCTWSDFDDWTFCSGEGACSPGDTESRDVSCGACGNGTRVEARTCSSACAWGNWSLVSDCTDETLCIDRDGNAVCPGGRGVTHGDCTQSHHDRRCTCSSSGDWVLCSSCRGGL